MGAIIAAAAIGAGAIAVGAYQNNQAQQANDRAFNISREDYGARLLEAAKMAKELSAQYNEIVSERPNLSFAQFARERMRAVEDPFIREVYTNAKEEDFNVLRQFAEQASTDNAGQVMDVANKLSNGRWSEFIDQRNDLVMNTNAADRYARAYELAAPVRSGASTVRYDDQGRLIEGQRADKQAFDIATEVQTAVEQEQKQDLRALESDRLSAAERQTQRASDFMQFYDATGYATALESDRQKLLHSYQTTDEERAFRLYEMFAAGAAGIQPTNPTYQNTGVGNQLISSGVQLASGSLTNYGNQTKQQNTGTTGNTYK